MRTSVLLFCLATLFAVTVAKPVCGTNWDKQHYINNAKYFVKTKLLEDVTEEQIENMNFGELFDVSIRGLKAQIAKDPKAEWLLSQHIEHYERQKEKYLQTLED